MKMNSANINKKTREYWMKSLTWFKPLKKKEEMYNKFYFKQLKSTRNKSIRLIRILKKRLKRLKNFRNKWKIIENKLIFATKNIKNLLIGSKKKLT